MFKRTVKRINKILIVEEVGGNTNDVNGNILFTRVPICSCCIKRKLSPEERVRVEASFDIEALCEECSRRCRHYGNN